VHSFVVAASLSSCHPCGLVCARWKDGAHGYPAKTILAAASLSILNTSRYLRVSNSTIGRKHSEA